MSQAVKDVVAERERQKSLEVVQTTEPTNTTNDFVAYITAYAGRAAEKVARNEREGVSSRDMFVKVGALAVAAIEKLDS